jgi:hypothetical protein
MKQVQNMMLAAMAQAQDRAGREGRVMVVWHDDGPDDCYQTDVWYVRPEVDGPPPQMAWAHAGRFQRVAVWTPDE